MKQVICDKCEKILKVVKKSKVKVNGKVCDDFGWANDLFGGDFFGELGDQHEGSTLQVNLPRYKVVNKVYDLCESCTKEFLHTNIQGWLKSKKKK